MVGWLTYLSGSQRVGMSTVVIFFTLGLLVLLPLKLDHQPQAAGS
jgi:UMF1 family MFS transporter